MSESPRVEPGDGPTPSADALRTRLADQLCEWGVVRTGRIAEAVRAVPRHLFTPGVSLETAYAANEVVVTKRDKHGMALSSVSAPGVIATMLEQAQVEPGQRVLEIGSGGYNAGLLAELAGPDGSVTTIDIDPEVVERARACLAAADIAGVRVLEADGEYGAAEYGPFDRIIVTAGAWDIPPAWANQLAEGGRLVVPLRMRSLTRSIAFEREGRHLIGRDYRMCGFVPIQGAGEHRQPLVELKGRQVGLQVDDDAQVDADRLRAALAAPRKVEWSQVTVGGNEPFDDLELWLATTENGFGFLAAQQPVIERGLVSPVYPWGAPAIVEQDSFAYLTKRPTTVDTTRFELGVVDHGPAAGKLALRFIEQIRTWDRDRRCGPHACIQAHPADTPDKRLPVGLVLNKTHTKVTISWP